MIVETIIAGLTVIFISSLAFANAQIKRQRQWDKEDNAPEPEPDPPPRIYPFIHIKIGTPCPKCLREAKNEVKKTQNGWTYVVESAEGPGIPKACYDDKCKAKNIPHLHASCNTCNYNWFMNPADEKEKEDDNRQPHPSGTEQSHSSVS